MRRLAALACVWLFLVAPARGQTLSGSPLQPNVPTLHQFGSAYSSASYAAGQVECGAGALTASVPLGCLNTDWMMFQDFDFSLATDFRLGGTWAAGDKVGVDFWLGTGTGSYSKYPVLYTVQASDISGGGNSLATYQNILKGLVGTDQSGQGAGGCINGTGGYGPALGMVPAAPANCTGTAAFLLAMERFPDTSPVAGNGYRPQAFAQCPGPGSCYLAMDFPWGNVTTGGFALHPAVNVALPDITSSAGTFVVVQQPAATIENQIVSTGNALDNGPILGAYRQTVAGGRPDVVGDMQTRLDLGNGEIYATVRGAVGQSSAAYASGSTVVLSATPIMPPSMTLPAGGAANLIVQDATTPCAIGPTTTLAAWNSGTKTITLSAAVNGTAPCPGIVAGDMISITDNLNVRGEFAFAPNSAKPSLFIGEGLRTNGTLAANSTCAADPGFGGLVACGWLQVGDGSTRNFSGEIDLLGSDSTAGSGPGLVLWSGNYAALVGQIGDTSLLLGSTDAQLGIEAAAGKMLRLWAGGRTQIPADLQIGSDGGVTAGNASDQGAGTIAAAAGVYSNGVQLKPVLAGTSGSFGGSAVGAGACTAGTVPVANSTTAMAVEATPAAYPGDGFTWAGYVSAAGTVTVKICNFTGGSLTPTATAYNVRVLQ